MRMRFLIMLVAGGVWLAFAPGAVRAADGVEVLHWWTAGGESQAMDVVRQALRARGIPWRDVPVAGGGGDAAMTVLRARVTSRNAPAAAQVLGFDIVDWAEQRALVDLSAVAEKEHWDAHVPKAIQRFSKHGGVWIAAPINVHTTNWLWINKKALDAAGGKPPENWDELIAVLDAMQANDIIPLAHGGEDWQDATLFEAIVLSLGAEFYKKALIDLDPDALRSGRMTEAFTRLARLRTYVDENFSGREWNLATAMVIQGKAGMQQMGDWAKGEFLGAGLEPGADFVCIRFPGTQGAATFNSDQFVMFEGAKDRQAQFELASTIEDPQVQAAFNVIKGSVPARTDVPDTAFDACGKKGIADVAEADKAGTLLGSMAHGHAVPAAIKNAIFDVVTGHFNGDIATEDAAGELAGAVELAQ